MSQGHLTISMISLPKNDQCTHQNAAGGAKGSHHIIGNKLNLNPIIRCYCNFSDTKQTVYCLDVTYTNCCIMLHLYLWATASAQHSLVTLLEFPLQNPYVFSSIGLFWAALTSCTPMIVKKSPRWPTMDTVACPYHTNIYVFTTKQRPFRRTFAIQWPPAVPGKWCLFHPNFGHLNILPAQPHPELPTGALAEVQLEAMTCTAVRNWARWCSDNVVIWYSQQRNSNA